MVFQMFPRSQEFFATDSKLLDMADEHWFLLPMQKRFSREYAIYRSNDDRASR